VAAPIGRSLRKVMPHTVDIKTRNAPDKHNDATGYTLVAAGVPARVVDKRKMVRGQHGTDGAPPREIESTRQVFVAGDYNIGPSDQIVLTGFTPSTPPIISVERVPVRKGQHHMVVNL
jgi:hypothetical protein